MSINHKQTLSMKEALSTQHINDNDIEVTGELRTNLQSLLLSMFLDVKEVCDKHNIPLFLCGGSSLGAVRHKGFIPWDDDLDLSMTRTDYNHFQEIFEEELSDKYYLKAPGYKAGSRARFPKIMKKDTVFRERGNPSPESECGVFLDIFILDNVPDNKLLRKIKGVICNGLEFISGQVLLQEERADKVFEDIKKVSKGQYYLRKITGIVFSFRTVRSWNRSLDKMIQYKKDSEYLALATGRKHYFGEICPRNVFLPGKNGVFEGHEVRLFSDTDVYLTNLYGDYMEIPEESKREKHFIDEIKLKGANG